MADVGKQLLDVPFPQMVRSLAAGIAEAQFDLDMISMRLAQMMSGEYQEPSDPDNPDSELKPVKATVNFAGEEYSLLELGFTPTFYQFVDTIIEVKMSISTSTTSEQVRKSSSTHVRGKARVGLGFFAYKASMSMDVSTVSASYSNKYQYSAEGASLIRTKLVPVPSPAILEERIRVLLEERKKKQDEQQPG